MLSLGWFAAGAAAGVYVAQNYDVPDITAGAAWAAKRFKELEETYRKREDPGGQGRRAGAPPPPVARAAAGLERQRSVARARALGRARRVPRRRPGGHAPSSLGGFYASSVTSQPLWGLRLGPRQLPLSARPGGTLSG
eukprot:CAMPEP_0119119048 /NCGR_PEP_ID=MMETSP1310-20130426/712_1 /TAXON_ID=464262 /ORGANISM="Genus nov. species nov., Strain RCC2339" /LENGTH=137 /DNA_ID=CAMNT_0007108459 /DNA_START=24 /DNA_END=436 /DNA_ORIENTATION=+